ncbi:MAG TPA: ribonuclease P protein component, partial [Campylobacteraceae bacterium]|nr:ribonuclease P protein component [Campylobacteraceae bacterium]
KEFGHFYNRSQKKHLRNAILFYKEGSGKRVGFTASKKVGNAVARNFAKRRLRAAFLKIEARLKEGTYILVAKKEIVDADFKTIERDLLYGAGKLKALQ